MLYTVFYGGKALCVRGLLSSRFQNIIKNDLLCHVHRINGFHLIPGVIRAS